MSPDSSTIYIPIIPPPTPASSPRPSDVILGADHNGLPNDLRNEVTRLKSLIPSVRRRFLTAILAQCTPSELLFVSTIIAPLLKRDFLFELPTELALYILSFVEEPQILARVAQVSRSWAHLAADESLWRRLCDVYGFNREAIRDESVKEDVYDYHRAERIVHDASKEYMIRLLQSPDTKQGVLDPNQVPTLPLNPSHIRPPFSVNPKPSYRDFFRNAYTTVTNWRRGGHCLRTHRVPSLTPDSGVVTSVALDKDWLVAGLANHRIHVFSAHTGVLVRTLIGHELGVWAVNLVSRGGTWIGPDSDNICEDAAEKERIRKATRRSARGDVDKELQMLNISSTEGLDRSLNQNQSSARTSTTDPHSMDTDNILLGMMRAALGLDQPLRYPKDNQHNQHPHAKQSDVCGASEGWGQPNALVVSGGCDKVLRVWDIKSGQCIYVLHGHTSTVRCLRVLHNRPIAVSGSRDTSLRVWDVRRGRMLRVLEGHTSSVRALDVCGNRAVSGSYDCTCRVWDIDTGACLHVLRGHIHQIYSVAFDGERVASGGLDTTVRVWDSHTGHCLALLQGHTALVCQLQISPTLLATGGADGRVITFDLRTYTVLHRILAHDSSVTALQFDGEFLVTGGNDGRVRLYELESGDYVREMTDQSESVWKVVYRREVCAIMCKRAGKTVVEIWSFKSKEKEEAASYLLP